MFLVFVWLFLGLSAVARSKFHLRVLEFRLILFGPAVLATVIEIEIAIEINNQYGKTPKMMESQKRTKQNPAQKGEAICVATDCLC